MTRSWSGLHLVVAVPWLLAACIILPDEPEAGPERFPTIVNVGLTLSRPVGYLGLYASPSAASEEFSSSDYVSMFLRSSTGDTETVRFYQRYCYLGSYQFAVCHQYQVTLDTSFTAAAAVLQARGYWLNPADSGSGAVAYDFQRRAIGTIPLIASGVVSTAALTGIGLRMDERRLHAAIEITEGSSASGDNRLSVQPGGSVQVSAGGPAEGVSVWTIRLPDAP